MRIFTLLTICLFLAACQQEAEAPSSPPPAADAPETAAAPAPAETDLLGGILASQPEAAQARYDQRNPRETLEFFGIEPGMTVVEALPGGGWYSKILMPYLGGEGTLVGVDYAGDMWSKFGFFDDEFIEAKKTWPEEWTAEAQGWGNDDAASVSAFVFGAMPSDMAGTADAVLFVRAMHNLARFESDGGFLTQALADAHSVLKPGGVVGIVQHHARDEMPDDWADGSRGYLKQGFVVEQMEKAGFEYIGSSDINSNDKDQPGENDIVWRLPPTLMNAQENEELKQQMMAIGESNRMTLKFRKPEA